MIVIRDVGVLRKLAALAGIMQIVQMIMKVVVLAVGVSSHSAKMRTHSWFAGIVPVIKLQ
jgi:hypothetical protein